MCAGKDKAGAKDCYLEKGYMTEEFTHSYKDSQ